MTEPIAYSEGSQPTNSPPLNEAPRNSVALWRWLLALVVIGSYPLMPFALRAFGPEREGPALPQEIGKLLIFCAIQMFIFGVFWVIAWALAQPKREQLGWQWSGTYQPVGWGLVYFAVLRFAPVVLVIFGFLVALAAGLKLNDIQAMVMANRPSPEALVSPDKLAGDPLYMFLVVTLVSFVVAGLREELWRVFTMSALSRVFPKSWKPQTHQIVAVALTSVIFGLGHIAQGPIAMVITGVLGLVLGAAIQIHRSIWPAVIAHGLFDASSFLLLPLALKLQKSGLGTKIMMILGW